MISETSKNSQNQALEERLSNMHEQMAGVTSRLDQTVHEELIWKSYASNKLLAQLEVRKYMDYMPFNRQINQMKRDGLTLAPATVNDWHVNVCDTLVPLYRLQI